MAVDREAIYTALSARLATALSGSATFSRRVKHWSQVDAAQQPYICIGQGDEAGEGMTGLPTKWRLHATVYVYVHDTSDAGPAARLNSLVTSVERALEWQVGDTRSKPGSTGNLGGLVEMVRVTSVETDEGALGDQGVCVLGLEILTHA